METEIPKDIREWIKETANKCFPECIMPPFRSVKAFDLNGRKRQVFVEGMIAMYEMLSNRVSK